MKNKKRWFYLIFFTLLISVGFTWRYVHRDELAVQAYVDEINAHLERQSTLIQSAQASETPEHKERVKAHWELIGKVAEGQVRRIDFVGRIVDQYGEPIRDAKVGFEAGGNFLSAGSGGRYVHTDNDGYFIAEDVKGESLALAMAEKDGYDINIKSNGSYPHFYAIKKFPDSLLWKDYTRENPYVIRAYRVEKYAKVKSENNRGLDFIPNGSVYTIDFSGEERVKWEGIRDGDIRIIFTRNDKEWQVKVESVDGGLQETSDTYMNMAPESGYQKSLIYSGKALENFNISRSISVKKNLYFVSHHGKRYGALRIEILPYSNEKKSGISVSYAINLYGGRELAVKPKK